MPTPIVGTLGSRGTAALPGYSVFILPWAGEKSRTWGGVRAQNSGFLGGGFLDKINTDQTNTVEWDVWLDAGTYKFAAVIYKHPSCGILTVYLNGVSQGTIDGYAAAEQLNQYAELTGIAVAAGLYTLSLKTPTKNASATNYYAALSSLAWIRTGP